MSDPRWLDVQSNVESAVLHFSRAIQIHDKGISAAADRDFYMVSMAFMHAMLAGHTSAEVAIERILDILDEQKPSGPDWHQMLIRRMARPVEGRLARPALLTEQLAKAMTETKNFRHRALHTYDDFNFARAMPAVKAARIVVEMLPPAVATFRGAVDPDL